MPILAIMIALAGAGAGAFVGSQIDDALDPVTTASATSPTRLLFYAAAGVAIAYGGVKVWKMAR